MELKQFLSGLTPKQREQFAKKARTSPAYLIQLAGRHRMPSPDMAKRLATASDHQVTLADLRPDIWSDVA